MPIDCAMFYALVLWFETCHAPGAGGARALGGNNQRCHSCKLTCFACMCRSMRQSLTAVALAMALSGMPELISLYNEHRLAGVRLAQQKQTEPLHAAQPQVCCRAPCCWAVLSNATRACQ